MSNKIKNKQTNEEVVLDATDNNGGQVENDDLFWDDLMTARMETAKTLLGQQHLLVELATMYKEVLANDKKLEDTVDGLSKAYKDIGTEIRSTMNKHITFDKTSGKIIDSRKGKVEGDDEYYDYIQIGGEYISSQEKVANLASTAYLDIFTQLKVGSAELDKLKNLPSEGKKIIDDTLEEVGKETKNGN